MCVRVCVCVCVCVRVESVFAYHFHCIPVDLSSYTELASDRASASIQSYGCVRVSEVCV